MTRLEATYSSLRAILVEALASSRGSEYCVDKDKNERLLCNADMKAHNGARNSGESTSCYWAATLQTQLSEPEIKEKMEGFHSGGSLYLSCKF